MNNIYTKHENINSSEWKDPGKDFKNFSAWSYLDEFKDKFQKQENVKPDSLTLLTPEFEEKAFDAYKEETGISDNSVNEMYVNNYDKFTDFVDRLQSRYKEDYLRNTIHKPITNFKSTSSPEDFKNMLNNYFSLNSNLSLDFGEGIDDDKMKHFLTRLAGRESSFRSIQNMAGAPAYGYFQLWKTNIEDYTPEQILNNPNEQMRLQMKLMKNNWKQLTSEDKQRMKDLGITTFGALGAMHLGGVGGFRSYIHEGKNRSDGHHYSKGKGASVKEYIDIFNFKKGGIITNNDINIGDKKYSVKIAQTDEEKEKGLSNKKELPRNQGMLFIIDPDDKDEDGNIWFTMEDTEIPLDVIFIDEDLKVNQVSKGIPFSKDPIYGSADFVLEVNQKSGITIGDELEFIDDKELNNKMFVLDSEGKPQMILEGGERIMSINNTKTLIKFAKKADVTKNDNDYKALGKRVFKFLNTQDTNEPEFVE